MRYFWMFASLMEVSSLITWSMVDLCFLNPHWESVIRLLDSINKTNLLLTIHSMVLQRQLVSATGLWLAGFELSFPGFSVGMIVAIIHVNPCFPRAAKVSSSVTQACSLLLRTPQVGSKTLSFCHFQVFHRQYWLSCNLTKSHSLNAVDLQPLPSNT